MFTVLCENLYSFREILYTSIGFYTSLVRGDVGEGACQGVFRREGAYNVILSHYQNNSQSYTYRMVNNPLFN